MQAITIPIGTKIKDVRHCLKCGVIVGFFNDEPGSQFMELENCALPHGSEYRCKDHPQLHPVRRFPIGMKQA
jgi:hypothetical protein